MSRPMSRRVKVALIVAGVALAGAVVVCIPHRAASTMTVTAQFEDSVGLYEGNAVSVLGMRIGEVASIVPKTTYVEVTLAIDKHIAIPADAQAVTVNTSLLTDRHIELTPAYRGGPTLKNGDVLGLARTRTPVEFDRTLRELDQLSSALSGDGRGSGPLSDLIGIGHAVTSGNGIGIKAALDELSQALRLGADNGVRTKSDIQSIVTKLSELTQAAADNDSTVRQFGANLRQVSAIVADERIGSGDTGKRLNGILAATADLLERNRDKLKDTLSDSAVLTGTLAEKQRELAETLDLLPLLAENFYNTVDTNSGSLRAHVALDKLMFDSGLGKEICNLINKKQLGCATGTIRDYGPDFGLSMMLDQMGAGQP